MRNRLLYTLLYIACLLLGMPERTYGQDLFADTGPLSFSRRQAELRPGELVSNVVRVVNTSNRMAEFTLRFSAPAGWQIIGQRQRNFSLQSGDTLFVPVRVIAPARMSSSAPQALNATLLRQGTMVASADWTLLPRLRSQWNASLLQRNIIIAEDADSTSFKIALSNRGDISEILSLSLELPPGISQLNAQGESVRDMRQRFRLEPGRDTTLTVLLGFDPLASELPMLAPGIRRNQFRVRTLVESDGADTDRTGSWRGGLEVKKLKDHWQANPSAFRTIPLVAEFNAYDVLQENSYGTLSLFGSTWFNAETSLTYYLQSSFTSNYLNPESFLGQYLQINFQSRYFGVELGNVSQNNEGANISGQGAKLWGYYGPHRLGLTYVESPDLFKTQKNYEGIGVQYFYQGRGDIRGGAYAQLRENFLLKTDEMIGGAWVGYRFFRSQHIRIAASVSEQTHNWNPDSVFILSALGYRINYNGSFNRLSYSAGYAAFDPTHLARRGTQQLNARAAWRFDNRHSLSGSYSRYSSEPEYYYRGQLRQYETYRQRELFRLGYNYRGQVSDVSLSPLHERFQDPWIVNYNTGMEAEYRLRDFHDIRFMANVFAGYTLLPEEEELDPFFVARIRSVIGYFQYSLNLRYYYGPYYSAELRRFADSRQNTNRFSAGFNFDQPMVDNSVLFRFNMLYNYATYNQQNMLSARPEIFYFPQAGLRFGVYARYYALSSQRDDLGGLPGLSLEGGSHSSSRFEFGFSIRKDFNIPVSGRKYFDLTVKVYRDASGTGTYVSGDPGIADVWVRLQQLESIAEDQVVLADRNRVFEALTNRRGEVLFSNIPPGNYLMMVTPVASAGSRFESRTMEVIVSREQTLYVSIDRGARVSGSIILERDQFTRAEYFPLGAIRITATDDEGQQFSTLTSESGQYHLYLPKGRFNISVNENVFGADFQLLQNNIPVEIMHEHETIRVNFNVRERGRQIRIQRPGEDPED